MGRSARALFFAILILVFSAPSFAQERKSALVLWASEGEHADYAELYAIAAANLAGRHADAVIRPIGAYEAGAASGFDLLMVVAPSYDQPIPDALARDAVSGLSKTLWIQYGLDALLAAATDFDDVFGWRADGYSQERFDAVRYRGERFTRHPEATYEFAPIRVTDPGRAEVLAALETETGDVLPWAVRSGHLTYVVETPFGWADEDDRYLVFADILSRLLEPDLPSTRYAMVRIEDVGPDSDPEILRDVADRLEARNAPFSVTVYDTYADPLGAFHDGRAVRYALHQRPLVARALRHMVRRGGTLVMHGHTHQHGEVANPHEGVSGGDYEFFLAGLDEEGAFELLEPVPGESVPLWLDVLDTGLDNWDRAGLPRPWIFTFPHYAGSLDAYRAASGRFSARFERPIYFVGELSTGAADYAAVYNDQYFPYPVRDIRGDVILPETLGNYDAGGRHGRTAEAMLESARRNLVLREAYASFFHHWFLEPETLDHIVVELQAMGYEFIPPGAAAAAIPPRSGPARPAMTAPGSAARMMADYESEIRSIGFWARDHPGEVALLCIGALHLLIFSIGHRRKRRRAKASGD